MFLILILILISDSASLQKSLFSISKGTFCVHIVGLVLGVLKVTPRHHKRSKQHTGVRDEEPSLFSTCTIITDARRKEKSLRAT